MNELPVPKIKPCVPDLVALGFPEIKTIAFSQIFKPFDRLTLSGLLCGRARKLYAKLSKELLHKPRAVNAILDIVAAPDIRNAKIVKSSLRRRFPSVP